MVETNVNIQVGGPANPASVYKTVVLKGNQSFASQVTKTRTKYVVKYNFDLNGATVTIPTKCFIEFDGGSISNGTLVGNNTILIYNQALNDIFSNVDKQGTFIYNNTLSADEITLTETGNLVGIKDGGVSTNKLANGAVTGAKLNANVVDDEDIHFTNDKKLQFKDKEYSVDNYSGLGRVYLRKNIVNGVNILTQNMINKANTIYVIQYDFTLGEDITIPKNCVLEFDGGSISASDSNDTITGNNTSIKACLVKIFNTDITIAGTWNVVESYPEWFGVKGDGIIDDTLALQKTIISFPNIIINKGTYLISSTISIPAYKTIKGIIELQDVGDIIIKTTANITPIKFIGQRSSLFNVTISHPATNTLPIIDISGQRYLFLKNIYCEHGGTNCPAIGLYCDNSSWCGYTIIDNCYISQYSICVKIENGTNVTFYNCRFNGATTQNLYLKGEIFTFFACDISGNNLGVEYVGKMNVYFYSCYLEPRLLGSFAKVTNGSLESSIKIIGGKLPMNVSTVSAKKQFNLFNNIDRFSNPSDMPNFANGRHSSLSKVINGNFNFGTYKWTYSTDRITTTVINSNLPDGYNSGIKLEYNATPVEFYQIIGKLPKGTYTLNFWIKNETTENTKDVDVMLSEGTSGSAYNVARLRNRDNQAFLDWTLINVIFEVTDTEIDKNLYLRFYCSNLSALYLTGISINKGIFTANSKGTDCPEDMILTKGIVIKGQDDKLYTISVNAGVISATEVS